MQLNNRVAIITGGARGLGREFALRFVKEGAKVTVCDILDCKETVAEIKALGGQVLALKTDVTSEKDTLEMAVKTVKKFGRIDILVNNAAVFGGIEDKHFARPFEEISVADWDKMMAVNVKGIFLCCKAVAPYMKKQKSGKILNIASTVAYFGAPDFLHYTTSKGGVVSLTKGLARSLGKYDINVNAIAPGMTWTEASRTALAGKSADSVIATQVLKRLIKPEDITGSAVFLCSADADVITGQILCVNAGEYL